MEHRRAFLGGLAASVVPLPSVGAATGQPIILEARPGNVVLGSQAPTPAWTYNGQVPGPLLRVKKGSPVAVRLVNKLDQPTTLCWHGVRIANALDGVAGLTQQPVRPGESLDFTFVPPDAGLFWYHPHVWPVTAEQIGRGLYGALIVDEPNPPDIDRDLLVVLDDWTLDAQGRLDAVFLDPRSALHAGRIGPLVTVNGRATPVSEMAAPGARLRLRFLNACAARIALVRFVDMAPSVIAVDGQPSAIFQPARATVPIGPGARFEVIVDLPAEPGRSASVVLGGEGGPDLPLMVVTTHGAPAARRTVLAPLPDNPLLPTRIPLETSLRRDVILGGGAPAVQSSIRRMAKGLEPYWTINGVASDGASARPLFVARRGTTVTLTVVNKTAFPQQMHIHGHVWRLLHDLDDGWDPYWRDSVLLGPGKTKHVAFIADNPGRWALESSVLDRQVTGMATWFEVT